MILNDPKHDVGESASIKLKVLLLVLAVLVVGTLGYLVIRENNTSYDSDASFQITNIFKKKATPTVTATATPAISATATSTAVACVDTFLYTNAKYHFTLDLPCSWINYQVKTANIDGEVDTYYINIPTTDTTYAVADETKLAGYVNPVCIGVVAKANWTGSDDQLRDFGSKAGENANYVFTTSRMNGIIPSDLSTSITNTILNQVMGSFKLL